jgi:aspartate aminotransferase
MEVLVAQSYSKNLGLYAERVGAINVISSSPESATRYRTLCMPCFLIFEIQCTCLRRDLLIVVLRAAGRQLF